MPGHASQNHTLASCDQGWNQSSLVCRIPDDVESKEIVDLFNACIDLQPKARPTAIAACRIIDRFQ